MLNNAKTYLFLKLKTLIQLHNKILFIVLKTKEASNMGCGFRCTQLENQCNAFQYSPDTLTCSAAKVRLEMNTMLKGL